MTLVPAFVLSLLALAPAPPQDGATAPVEVIAVVQVHGNNVTPEAEILRLAGLTVGNVFGPTTIVDVRARLEAADLFQAVEVLKRYASIADLTRVAVVIIVNEHPASILAGVEGRDPLRVVRRSRVAGAMVMPILGAEEGYGLTYGARFAYAGIAGERSRLSFPLTWGGSKRVAAEFERLMARGPLSRIEVGSAIERRRNPAFDANDDRRRVWTRAERSLGALRLGGTVSWEHISYRGEDERLRSAGVDVSFDTRVDPALPRNAVYARASWTRIGRRAGEPIERTTGELQGSLGVFRQAVLVARVERDAANRALPEYLQPLLGGWSTLRGYRAGAFAGDTRVSGSIELRVPLSPVLSVGRAGVSLFVDAGAAYAHDARFEDQPLHRGVGAGAWWSATVLRLGLAVARGDGRTRVHFNGGVSF